MGEPVPAPGEGPHLRPSRARAARGPPRPPPARGPRPLSRTAAALKSVHLSDSRGAATGGLSCWGRRPRGWPVGVAGRLVQTRGPRVPVTATPAPQQSFRWCTESTPSGSREKAKIRWKNKQPCFGQSVKAVRPRLARHKASVIKGPVIAPARQLHPARGLSPSASGRPLCGGALTLPQPRTRSGTDQTGSVPADGRRAMIQNKPPTPKATGTEAALPKPPDPGEALSHPRCPLRGPSPR